jgi:hypothetical protein
VRPESAAGSASRDRRAAPAALSGEASGWQRALVGVAATLQVIVMALTLVSGMLLWVGWPYLVANVVAILGLVLVLVVGSRTGRSSAVIALLAVPFVSVALILGLAAFDEWQVARVACSDRELEAVAGLESPSGEPLAFDGTYEGCEARVDSDRASGELTAAFAATLRTAGWTVTSPDGGRMAHKDGVTLFVESGPESIKNGVVIGFTGIVVSVDDDREHY